MAKRLPGIYVTDMHFDHRRFNAGYRIPDSHGSVRIAAGIQQDTIISACPGAVQLIDDLPLYIALKIRKFNLRKVPFQGIQVICKSLVSVNLRLPRTQQVQIRSVDNGYLHWSG